MTDAVIATAGLRKTWGRTIALDALDLEVGRGEVFGLLGPNGAGKTTTVKLLLGLVRPTAGSGTLLGRPLGDVEARRRVGYLPELFRYQPWLTGREVLGLHARLAGLDPRRTPGEVERVLGVVGLDGRGGDRVAGYSKGMQQRLGLAAALLGDPELVLLDEPTSALDPVGRDEVRAIIRDVRARGATVVLNSHLLTEVERLADRAAIIHRGRVVAQGGLAHLLGAPALRVRVTDLPDAPARLAAFGPVTEEDGWLAVRPLAAERVPEVVAALVAAGGRVHAVEPGRGTLEAAFLELVRGPAAPAAPGVPAGAGGPAPGSAADPRGGAA